MPSSLTIARPAFLSIPDRVRSSAGWEAVELARSVGIDPDPEQELALDAILSEDERGHYVLESAIVCPRQNGKTLALQVAALHDLFLRDTRLVIWSAHRFRTTQEAHRDLVATITNYDELRRRVRKIRNANGEEGIELLSGARLDFLARTSSGGGGRGLSGDVVILDEALYLTPGMLGSLLPTLSARKAPAVRYGSSAGLRESEVLRTLRDRGRAGGDPSLVWVEWSTEPTGCARPECDHRYGTEGCQLDDVDLWRAANPALGRRITVEYLEAERRALPAREFMRERLGWWESDPSAGDTSVIDEAAWEAARDPESQIVEGERVAFAVDVSWDRSTAWVAVCGTREDGRPHVELAATKPSTEWVAGWLAKRADQYGAPMVALQGSGAPVSSLLDELRDQLGDRVLPMAGADLGRACGAFYDAITTGQLVHIGQEPLDEAVEAAVVRPLGDAWVWDRRRSPIDIAPLVAVTAALFAWQTGHAPDVLSSIW